MWFIILLLNLKESKIIKDEEFMRWGNVENWLWQDQKNFFSHLNSSSTSSSFSCSRCLYFLEKHIVEKGLFLSKREKMQADSKL